jgi:hypothetical protein
LERRRRTRFVLRASTHFRWENPEGLTFTGQGFTRDISSEGAYVYAEVLPPGETEVHIEILLPPHTESSGALRMRARARVIRVEPNEIAQHTRGFVAHSNSYEFYKEKR